MNRTGVAAPYLSGSSGSIASSFNGGRTPDLVGQLAVKQGWGEAGLNAAIHSASYYNVSPLTDTGSKTKTGYGLGAYAKINLPSLAAGDYIGFQANYDQNAMAFSGLTRSSQRFGVNSAAADYAFDNYGNHNQKAWNVIADLSHNWSPTVSTTIGGSYGQNRFSNVDSMITTSWAPNFDAYAFGQVTKWTPVKGIEFGLDTTYIRYSDKLTAGFSPAAATKSDDFQVDFRIIRSF